MKKVTNPLANELNVDAVKNNLAKHAIHVHKFGGSSLATPQCIDRVVDIIRQHCQLNDVVVVSANGNTTDHLFNLVAIATDVNNADRHVGKSAESSTGKNAEKNTGKNLEKVAINNTEEKALGHPLGHVLDSENKLTEAIQALETEQNTLIQALLNQQNAQQLTKTLTQDIQQLTHWLTENILTRKNDILAFGELWSARLLSAILSERVCPSNMIDARDFLVVANEQTSTVDSAISAVQLRQQKQFGKLAVITGYICKDSNGNTCTLGRNGSDYSATIIASLVEALNVTLWTDVDGIYSADPRVVPLARKLHRLPNGVAKELGRLGNPVLHEKTLLPLVNIDTNHYTHLHVASSFAAEVPGTEIGKFGQIAKQELSVTYLNDVLLAQSSSFKHEALDVAIKEFSPICFDEKRGFIVIRQDQQQAVSHWLASHDTEVTFKPVAIIATVGHKVAKRGDIKARFKRSLNSSQPLYLLNSENSHSIIAVLSEPCTSELVNNIHHDMTKDARNIGLVVAGLGNIGQRFLTLLPKQLRRVSALENTHLVGLLSSTKALINNDGIDPNHAYERFEQQSENYDHQQLLTWLTNHPYDELVVVDITPSEEFSLLYEQFFEQGIHVIGANKWAASSPTSHYNKLLTTAQKHHSLWLGNAIVGAGLPVNYAIEDLRNSGDDINEIAGIFSGTLSWLFESYDGSVPFSTMLLDALAEGITEPDPREDLSGRDVQRKLLILARIAGFTLSLDDIDCQNLVPETLQTLSKEAFLQRADELDDYFAHQLNSAKSQNACIRYIARFVFDKNAPTQKIKAQVSLEVLPINHAFAQLTPGDNIFQISSHWYHSNPLIICGPGAGRDVTAGGLHSDLVNICQQLSHKKHQVKIKGINQ